MDGAMMRGSMKLTYLTCDRLMEHRVIVSIRAITRTNVTEVITTRSSQPITRKFQSLSTI
eukprot:1341467-Heterocapsa_arctica.AAC.1